MNAAGPAPDSFSRNVLYAVISNLVVAVVSALSIVVIPRFIGVVDYGYWQLFVFYSSYVLMLQLGLGDGAYLRYGGARSDELRPHGLGAQALILLAFLSILAVGMIILAPHIVVDRDRVFAIRCVAVFALLANCRQFVMLHLQAIGEFRTYSRVSILDRAIFIVIVSVALIAGIRDYQWLIVAELIAKLVSLFLGLYVSRRTFREMGSSLSYVRSEVIANVSAGLKLTIANTSNMLIIGVFRLTIDLVWGIAVFGALSLILNVSNFMMIFVSAVGMVLFPALRRASRDKQVAVYLNMRLPLSAVTLMLLPLVYLLVELLRFWLPEYSFAAVYLLLLSPMLVAETRMGLLINPLLKTLRKENALLAINLAAVVLGAIAAVAFSAFARSLHLICLSLVLVLFVRAAAAESVLLREFKLPAGRAAYGEIVLVATFAATALLPEPIWSIGVYLTALLVYLISVWRRLVGAIRIIPRLMRELPS